MTTSLKVEWKSVYLHTKFTIKSVIGVTYCNIVE